MNRSSAKTTTDYGPAEAAQHAPRVVEETGIAGVKRVRVQDLVDCWHEDGSISSLQRTAAESFMRDVYDAGMILSCEMKEKVDKSINREPSLKYIHATQNINNLAGRLTEYQFVCLFYVVGMGDSIQDAARRWTYRGRLPRSHVSVKRAIREALTIASRYYKLAP